MKSTETNGPRPWAKIREALQKPVPPRHIESKTLKGNRIDFVPWYRLQKILDHYTGGWWEYVIEEGHQEGGQHVTTVTISVIAAERTVSRQGRGYEESSTDSFGDPYSNAESQAFRRACARFGLGLDLWDK